MILPELDSDGLCLSGKTVWFPLSMLKEDFKYSSTIITKIYSFSCPRYAHKLDIMDRQLLWDREKDLVDWNKVKVGTKVLVRDSEKNDWKKAIFVRKDEEANDYKYKALAYDECIIVYGYRYCKLDK